jgi:hypothetical protein
MLGTDHQQSHMFSYMSPEARALREKTIRSVRLSHRPETGMWEITPEKSASVFEYVRSCRYAISSECHLMKTELPMS